MKRIIKVFCCAFLFLFCITTTACANNKPPAQSSLDAYKQNGYHEIVCSKYLKVKCSNFVTVKNHILCKNNTTVSFELLTDIIADDGFDANNLNFETGKVLSGFLIDEVFVDVENIENHSFKINKDTKVEAVKSSFEIDGVCIYTISAFNTNAETFLIDTNTYIRNHLTYDGTNYIATDNFLFYFVSNTQTNVTATTETVAVGSNKSDLIYNLEIPLETEDVYFFVLIKTENNKLILKNIGNSEVAEHCFATEDFNVSANGINNIKIFTIDNLSYLDEYIK